MAEQHAKWLRKKMLMIRLFCTFLMLLGFPLFYFLSDSERISTTLIIPLFLGYLIAIGVINIVLQFVKKPSFLAAKRNKYIDDNPDLSEEFKDAIRQGLTCEGMSAEMCAVSTGFEFTEIEGDDGSKQAALLDKPRKKGLF